EEAVLEPAEPPTDDGAIANGDEAIANDGPWEPDPADFEPETAWGAGGAPPAAAEPDSTTAPIFFDAPEPRPVQPATAPVGSAGAELAALLVSREPDWRPHPAVAGGPAIILIVGVNGTGKTTTIGKLASRYMAEGRHVLLAAADTFRAAAIDQLMIWADRAGV